MKYAVMWIHDDGYGGMQIVEAKSPREATDAYKTAINRNYVTFQTVEVTDDAHVTTFIPRVDERMRSTRWL